MTTTPHSSWDTAKFDIGEQIRFVLCPNPRTVRVGTVLGYDAPDRLVVRHEAIEAASVPLMAVLPGKM